MGKNRPRPKEAMVFATQSHAQAAGRPVSQASQMLVQDSQTRKLDRHLFNEAYLMHTIDQSRSTRSSPSATWPRR